MEKLIYISIFSIYVDVNMFERSHWSRKPKLVDCAAIIKIQDVWHIASMRLSVP